MNKKIRRDKTFLKYKNRIERFVANGSYVFIGTEQDRFGLRVDTPTVQQVMESKQWLHYKTTSTPCSCYCCSGAYKYRRHEVKIETRKLIKEFYESDKENCS